MDQPGTEGTPAPKPRFSWRSLLSIRTVNILLLLIVILYWPYAVPNRLQYWWSGAVSVDGNTMYLDPDDWTATSIILNTGKYEPEETAVIRERIKPGDTFVDVGASIGWYTVMASKLVGDKGRVIAFEPEPYAFSLLKRNVEANGCNNVVLVQKALSSEPGSITLFVAKTHRGEHSVVMKGDSEVSIEVETIRLDDYLQAEGYHADFIKIDVEGAEGMVLAGTTEVLDSDAPLSLMIEYAPDRLQKSGYDGDELLRKFVERGFEIYYLDEATGQLQASSPQDVAARMARESRVYTNLFLQRDGGGSESAGK